MYRTLFRLLCLLALAAPLPAQIALVNHVTLHSTGSSSTSAPISTTGSTLLIACFAGNSGNNNAPVDSAGNTWTLVNLVYSYYSTNRMWISVAPITSAAHTFTIPNGNLAVLAFSGVASGPDQTNSNSYKNTPMTTGSVTPSNADELVAACLSFGNAAGPVSISTPFTLEDQLAYSDYQTGGIATAYQIQTAAAAQNPTWTSTVDGSGGQAAGANIATFYSTLAPGPLSITAADPMPEAVLGSAYTYCPVMNGGIQPYTLSVASGLLPGGVSIVNNCIAGNPTATASGTALTLRVTDSEGTPQTATATTHLTVVATALSIATTTCPDAKQLTTYAGCTIAAAGGNGTYSYSVFGPHGTSGGVPIHDSLPEGMFINASTGAITSTGDVVRGQGVYSTLLQAADTGGGTTSQLITFTVAGDNSFGGVQLFPSDSIYHLDVSTLPADTAPAYAAIYSAYAGAHLRPLFGQSTESGGIPINTVGPTTPALPLTPEPGVFYVQDTTAQIPCDAAIEGNYNSVGYPTLDTYTADNHILTVVTGSTPALFETYQAYPDYPSYTGWHLGCSGFGVTAGEASFDINSHTYGRANGQSGVDAAGMSLAATLLNYDEVAGSCAAMGVGHECGAVLHPIRFTLGNTLGYHMWPATVQAGLGGNTYSGGYVDPTGNKLISQASPPTTCNGSPCVLGAQLNPMGQWLRLPLSVAEPTACSTYPQTHIIFQALQRHGIINADNGSTGYLVGTPDSRWLPYAQLQACLTSFTLGQFETVNVQSAAVNWPASYQVTGATISGSTTGPVGKGALAVSGAVTVR
ncbi:MAG: hypothetical protein M3O02_09975 [Acidobacteriota bacterium]|nr:hypothetical protein [Acidobacteriota bacterium]